jgi:hypothetical protein
MAACFTLWDLGWRERFEIIFDQDVIFGPRARHWYPFMRRLMEIKYPDEGASLMPVDPMFRTDDEFMPLQAADLFAWCARDSLDNVESHQFAWLFEQMPNVKGTVYSQYYDLARMQAVKDESYRIVANPSEMPQELVTLYAATKALKPGK